MDLIRQRHEAVSRKRRIILNNDGNEPTHLIQAPTEEEILKYRTLPLLGSQVDTVFYCSCGGGFGLFKHLSRVGQIFTTTEGRYAPNKMKDLAERGIDPLRVIGDFCRSHKIGFFWSLRMNDTHDGSASDYGSILFRTNRLKNAHPEYLIGSAHNPPRYGSWTAVDYGLFEVRELSYLYVEEVVGNYDIDGVELDFFRHPVFFRRPAYGMACSRIELDLMTDLVARIRRLLDEQAVRKGRPLLLAVRTPDHPEYCRKIGLDLERWLSEGLVDLYIPGGYFHLQPWERSVDLGHRYGVKVYPSLDESRVKLKEKNGSGHEDVYGRRRSMESYRGRAMNVLHSGADGVYLFNFFDPESPILREIGERETMRNLDKVYFGSFRGVGRVAGDGFPHEEVLSSQVFDPQHPLPLYPGKSETIEIVIPEDARGTGTRPRDVSLVLSLERSPAPDVTIDIELNGHPLSQGERRDRFIVHRPDTGILIKGSNRILLYNPGGKTLYVEDLMMEFRFL